MAFIEFNSVVKSYPSGRSIIKALDQASFTADHGKLTIILGASGAGKTTALNILGGMDNRHLWSGIRGRPADNQPGPP